MRSSLGTKRVWGCFLHLQSEKCFYTVEAARSYVEELALVDECACEVSTTS